MEVRVGTRETSLGRNLYLDCERSASIMHRSLVANETLRGLVNTMIRVSALLAIEEFYYSPVSRITVVGLISVDTVWLAIVLEIFLTCRSGAAA